jgi:FkbM family methyltransferase
MLVVIMIKIGGNKMRFITTVYGDSFLPLLWVHLQSIACYYPFNPVSIFYEDISLFEIKLLKMKFSDYEFIGGYDSIHEKDRKKRIALKLVYLSMACERYPNETLCILDCDTAICCNFSNLINNDFDVLYTWKNEQFPLNTGVIILKSKSNVRKFMKRWLKLTEKIVANPAKLQVAMKLSGGADQQAFLEILNVHDLDSITDREIDGEKVRFKGIACKYLNETNCVPITEDTHIIHYKSGWHSILLEKTPFTKNRPQESCKEMFDYWQRFYQEVTTDSIKFFTLISASKCKGKFVHIIDGYEERGILHSEMLGVCSVIQNLDVDLVIESGRYRGQSTEVLAKYFSDTKTKILSIEINRDENAKYVENRLKHYSNLRLMYGDANNVILKVLTNHRGEKVAILFDGPKGKEAIDIFKKVICDFPEVIVGFFHDLRKPTKEMPNPHRKIMENSFDRIFFTDDNEYVEHFRYLDQPCLPKSNIIIKHWRPWMKGDKKIGSYGPTIAVVIPTIRDRQKEYKIKSYNLFMKQFQITKRIWNRFKHLVIKLRTKVKKDKLVRKKVDGHIMNLDLHDGGISKALYNSGYRELAFMSILKGSIKKNDICLDIGANIGYTTLAMLKRAKKVIAVEPDPHNFNILKLNVYENRYLAKCELYQIGLSNVNKEMDFWLASKPNLSSITKNRYSIKSIRIQLKTLTKLLGDVKVDFIKMDIEGHEVEVLEGGIDYFSKTQHRVKILFELHPYTYSENHSLANILRRYFKMGFNTKYVVSTPIPRPLSFKKRGYEPIKEIRTDGVIRGIYNNITNEDAIKICCYCHSDEITEKIARSMLIERKQMKNK